MEKETQSSSFEDFFTTYLEKKKRNYVKKLTKLTALAQKDPATLTPEQKEQMANKAKLVKEVEYYDSIKDHYFKALSKKKKGKSTEDKTEEVPETCNMNDIVNKTVGLYYAGKLIEQGQADDNDVKDLHRRVFNVEKIESAESTLVDYLNSDKCTGKVKELLAKPQETPKEKVAETPQEKAEETPEEKVKETPKETKQEEAMRKDSTPKPKLFDMTSEEEDISEDEKDVVNKDDKQDGGPKIIPLPDNSDDEEEDFSKAVGNKRPRRGNRRRDNNRNYKKHNDFNKRGPNKRGRARGNRTDRRDTQKDRDRGNETKE